MSVVGLTENVLPSPEELRSLAIMDGFGREQSYSRVAMFLVVPGEKLLRKSTGVFDSTEALREIRAVLERLELRFRERIVVTGMRPAMGFSNSQVAKKKGNGLGFHGGAPIRMESQLAGQNVLLATGLLNQPFGQCSRFTVCNHPSDHISAKYIKDHIEIEVAPFLRTEEFGDVPGPNLVCCGGEKFRFCINGVPELVAAFFDFLIFLKNAVHGPDGTKIVPFIEEGGIDLMRSEINKALTVKDV
jgi:hypothetical protein